jgi:hypothetical protein
MPALPVVPALLVVLPEAEDPGAADELVDPFAEPGKVPQLLGLAEDVPPGLELPGAPGVTVFGVVELGVVVFGVVVLGVVVLGLAVLGVVVLGVVVPGVVCVVSGIEGVVLCGVVVPGVVPACGVAVGDVGVPAGAVVAPGVEVCPAVPDPPAGADPPAGELWATTQLPQHKITDSKVSLVIDIS